MIKSHKKSPPRSERGSTTGGFTLIELLLYIGISALMLLLCTFFLSGLLESRIKNQIIFEVDAQGTQAMLTIAQTLRNADTVNSPTVGTVSPSLSVNTIVVANNPTIFDVLGGALRIKEGSAIPIQLTNSRVTISNLSFSNLSRVGTPGILRIQFTISASSTSTKNEYSYSKDFVSSASLRQP
jgi:Tfp pilus assembly protein FimT